MQVRWTVGRRVAAGYAAVLALMVAVAAFAMSGLFRSSTALRTTAAAEAHLAEALEAVGHVDRAVVSFLRYLVTGDESRLEERRQRIEEANRAVEARRAESSSDECRAAWVELSGLVDEWEQASGAAIAAKQAGRQEDAARIVRERVQPARDRQLPVLRRVIQMERGAAAEAAGSAAAGVSRAMWRMTLSSAFALALGVMLAWGLTVSVARPLHETASVLATASTQIVTATTQQAAGTAEEAAAVHQTSTTMEQLKQAAQLVARKAHAVAEAAQLTTSASQDGRSAVDETVKAALDAKARIETLAQRVMTLSEQAQAIAEIVSTVNDLAEQSNLLAVNAAIEAAKAGEAGKGFGVVALEVKSIAEQSKQATAQIKGIINDLHRAMQAAVTAAEHGVKASEASAGLARRSGDSIRTLTESIHASAQAAQQILVATQQQAAGVEQAALAMQNIQQSSTQNIASTRQVENAARDLNEMAQRLRALTGVGGGRDFRAAAW